MIIAPLILSLHTLLDDPKCVGFFFPGYLLNEWEKCSVLWGNENIFKSETESHFSPGDSLIFFRSGPSIKNQPHLHACSLQ